MQVINVVAAIIKSGDKVFITERGHGEFKGKWMEILTHRAPCIKVGRAKRYS